MTDEMPRMVSSGGALAPVARAAVLEDIEHQVLSIWRQCLNAPGVGLDDDFASCGGKSLAMILIIMRIQDALQFEFAPDLAVQALYGTPTARVLARHVYKVMTQDSGSDFQSAQQG